MVDAESNPISDSVQMYLVKIKRLEDEVNPVPLSYLADSLSISPVSVNEMCRKMQDQNLIEYQPYKGASLTAEGNREALQILRRHRLWEVFLVEKLNFSFSQAHQIADELEHATSNELAERLNTYLGNPAVNPEGKEIPMGDGTIAEISTRALSSFSIGDRGICLLKEVDEGVRDYLIQTGCPSGREFEVAGKTDQMLLLLVNGKYISIGRQIADNLMVIEMSDNDQNGKDSEPPGVNSNNNEEIVRMEITEKTNVEQQTLDKMKIGQKGTVVSVGGKGPIKQRMMDMGLVPGSEVEVIRVAPLGDPIEVNLKGYNLSLRRAEAKAVQVEVKSGGL